MTQTDPPTTAPILFQLTLHTDGTMGYEGKSIADADFAAVLRTLANAVEAGAWRVNVT